MISLILAAALSCPAQHDCNPAPPPGAYERGYDERYSRGGDAYRYDERRYDDRAPPPPSAYGPPAGYGAPPPAAYDDAPRYDERAEYGDEQPVTREQQTRDGILRETWGPNGYVRETWGANAQGSYRNYESREAFTGGGYGSSAPPQWRDDRPPGIYPRDDRYGYGANGAYGYYGAYGQAYQDCPCDCPPPVAPAAVQRETVDIRGWGATGGVGVYGDYYGGGGGGGGSSYDMNGLAYGAYGSGLGVGIGAGAAGARSSSSSSASSSASVSSSTTVNVGVHVGGYKPPHNGGGGGCNSCSSGGHGSGKRW